MSVKSGLQLKPPPSAKGAPNKMRLPSFDQSGKYKELSPIQLKVRMLSPSKLTICKVPRLEKTIQLPSGDQLGSEWLPFKMEGSSSKSLFR